MSRLLGAWQGAFGRVTHVEVTNGVSEHAHPHLHLLFKLGGKDRAMRIGGELRPLSDDRFIMLNPWRKHSGGPMAASGPISSARVLALYLDPAWLADRTGGRQLVFATDSGEMTSTIRGAARHLGAILAGEGTAGARAVDAMLDELLARAVLPNLAEPAVHSAYDFRIRHAVRRLKERPQLHVDYAGLARNVGLSRSRFYEQFRNAVGVAPNMFVDGLLLEEACTLMAESGQPLDSIAAQLGFSAQSSFTRFFRERVGFPPSTLRRSIERRPQPVLDQNCNCCGTCR